MQPVLFRVDQKPPTEVTDNTIMWFGKYKGKKRLHQVPAIYLLWLYNKGCKSDKLRKYIIANLHHIQKAVDSIPKR